MQTYELKIKQLIENTRKMEQLGLEIGKLQQSMTELQGQNFQLAMELQKEQGLAPLRVN